MPCFSLDVQPDGIAEVVFDTPGAKVNTLGAAVLKELGELVGGLEKRGDVKGLLFRSGKPGQFVAGADLNEIGALAYLTPEQARMGLEAGHQIFNRISKLPFPTVALVDGPSMGGGTELVLAMDYRIASTNPKTVIGLPETKLGIIPAWGGTQRLQRLVGVHPAIEMITTGEPAKATKAAHIGLVFDAVPADRLIEAGRALLQRVQQTDEWKEQRQRRNQPLGLTDDQLHFAFAVAEGAVKEKTKGQYPAPLVALASMRDGCNLPLDQALEVEKKTAAQVFGSPIAANLIAVFFMTNRLERDPGVQDKNVKPREVKRVGVIGAGLMGAGIATASARSDLRTTLNDVDDARIAAGMQRARDVVGGRIKIGRATPEDMANMLANLVTGTNFGIFTECDVVIEAITENEKAKTETYHRLREHLKPDAILASNTSTISITRLAQAAPDAGRFIGMHFFNPVDRMQLVEVIRGEKTSDETVATTVALAKKLKKTPIVVRDCAGFLVNRILFPYMNEAIVLLQEGADMDAIDKAATRFGMPMGPILLEDVVGLDTALFAGKVIEAAYTDRSAPVPILADLVKSGRLGQKSGAGFRKFTPKHPKGERDSALAPFLERNVAKAQRTLFEQELTDRLFLPMLFEASRALEDGIVRDPADVDMGLILGIGFPPFRGGILRWCDSEGADNILRRAVHYASLGKRFQPTETIRKQAQSGEKFYPRPKNLPTFGG